MFSIFNVQAMVSVRVDEKEGWISLQLAGREEPLVINKDDELYERHLINIKKSYDAIVAGNPNEAELKEREAQAEEERKLQLLETSPGELNK